MLASKKLFSRFFAEYGNEIFKNYIVAVGKEFFHVGVGACSPGKYGQFCFSHVLIGKVFTRIGNKVGGRNLIQLQSF